MGERLLLVECPALAGEEGEEEDGDDGGEALRRFARVVEALAEVCPWVDPVRPGVCTLPVRGPARYFGDDAAVLARVRSLVSGLPGGELVRLGVAEGVFAARLAASLDPDPAAVVPPGATAAFLAPWPVDVLGDPDLADVLVRLGLASLGRFAALPAADVSGRFGAAGARLHRVARGDDGELPGWRVPAMGRRLEVAVGRALAPAERQDGFWGGAGAADERAAEALTTLQRRLGPEAVVVAVLGGGRSPADRVRLVPWRPPGTGPEARRAAAPVATAAAAAAAAADPADRPWPGRLPPPSPARVATTTVVAEVVDAAGAPVGVSGRGLLTARPERVSLAGGPWARLAGWSAPWPVEERWWTRARRRAARLQVVTEDGRALLLVVERGRWRLEAAYA